MTVQSPLLIPRKKVPELLEAELGVVVTIPALETMATRGGGPPFRRFGRAALYPREELMAWATNRLSPLMANTSTTVANQRAA